MQNVELSPAELSLGIEELEPMEAPSFWDGFVVGAGIGTAAGAAIGAGIAIT